MSINQIIGVAEHASDGVIVTKAEPLDDSGPSVVYVNPAFRRLAGIGEADRAWLAGFPLGLSDTSLPPAKIRQMLRRGRSVRFDARRRNAKGDALVVETTVVPLLRGDGAVRHIVWTERDVTEQRRVAAALKQSEERFQDMALAASDWFWETGPDMRFTFISRRAEDPSKIPVDFFLGKVRLELIDPDYDPEGMRRHLEDLAARRPFRNFVYRQQSPAGGWRLIRTSGRPFFDAEGAFCGYRGAGADVTAEIARDSRLEREVEERSRLLRMTLENLGEAIAVFDAEMSLIVHNELFMRLMQLPEELTRPGTSLEAIVRYLYEQGLYPASSLEAEWARRLAWAEQPMPVREEMQLTDGRHVERRRNPTPDGGFVTVYADITDRKAVENDLLHAKEAAESANRMKGEFLANMSHELRTPLNAILGFSEIIYEEMFGPIGNDRYKAYLQDIRASAEHLLQIINDVLDMSRLDARKLEPQETEFDLRPVLASCHRLISERAERRRLSLHLQLEDDLPHLRADERMIRQIVLNLLSNAIKFTPEGGRITLAAQRVEGGLSILVEDTGIGMRSADIPRVLLPFQQIESAFTRRHEGTGLGLPIVKALVDLHGGSFQLSSEPGRGTRALVILPPERVVSRTGS